MNDQGNTKTLPTPLMVGGAVLLGVFVGLMGGMTYSARETLNIEREEFRRQTSLTAEDYRVLADNMIRLTERFDAYLPDQKSLGQTALRISPPKIDPTKVAPKVSK